MIAEIFNLLFYNSGYFVYRSSAYPEKLDWLEFANDYVYYEQLSEKNRFY